MGMIDDRDFFHPRRRGAPCIACPYGADIRDRLVKTLIKGQVFDLRTADGLFEGVARLLRAFGGTVVRGEK